MNLNSFYEPTLAVKLEENYNYSSDETAYFYSIVTFSSFLLMVTFSIKPIRSHVQRWVLVGILVAIVSLLFIGPSNILPDNIYLMAIGTGLLGISSAILSLGTVLLLMESLKKIYPS